MTESTRSRTSPRTEASEHLTLTGVEHAIEAALGPLLECQLCSGRSPATCDCGAPKVVHLGFAGARPRFTLSLCRCALGERLEFLGVLDAELLDDFAHEIANVLLGHLRGLDPQFTNASPIIFSDEQADFPAHTRWTLTRNGNRVVAVVGLIW